MKFFGALVVASAVVTICACGDDGAGSGVREDQTIAFDSLAPSDAVVAGPTYSVSASSSSGLPVAVTIDPTAASVCSIAGTTVSFIGAGMCVINANQAGNTGYNAAPQAQQSFNVGKGAQSISFTSTAPASATVGSASYDVTAVATSGLPVSLTVDSASSVVCSIAGSTVTFIGAGTCVINANQAGDAKYQAAPQMQQSFSIGKAAQTITITSTAPANATVAGATYNVTATATSGLAVTFSVDAGASSVCSIAGASVTFVGAGSCIINANQAGNATFAAATQVQQTFAVAKGSQTITFTSTPPTDAVFEGNGYFVSATASSGLAVTLTVDSGSTSVCSVFSDFVTFKGTGTCLLNANQAGNNAYDAAPQEQQSFLIGPRLGNDTYNVVGNTQLVVGTSGPASPFTTSSNLPLANDIADATVVVTTASGAATTLGGAITINQNGRFTYTPPVGVSSGTDSYVYTGTTNGVSRTATLFFNISNLVWYVNSASTGTHDGRSSSPFLGLGSGASNLGTSAAAGAYIYVSKGASTTPGAYTLLANQKLIGAGATLTVGDLTISGNAANAPTLTNTLSASGISGVTVSGIKMSTGAATAVNLTNTNGNFTFVRVDASGGANGIVWSNASPALATSSFTVTGDGTNTAVGGNGTGGTLSNMSGADVAIAGNAVYLNNVANVTLSRMDISGTMQNNGIRGYRVNGFTLEYSTVSGTMGSAASMPAPEAAGEGAVYFGSTSLNGFSTAATFTGNIISGGRARNLSITITSPITVALTLKGNTFGLNQSFSDASHSVGIEARASGAYLGAVVEANTFTGAPGDVLNITGTSGTAMDAQIKSNTFSNSHASNTTGRGGVWLSTASSMTFDIDGNTMRGASGDAIRLEKNTTGSGLSGRITNNTIGVAADQGSGSKTGAGVFGVASGTGIFAVTILNNQIRNWGLAGLYFDMTSGSYSAKFTIQGNTIAEPGTNAFASVWLRNGQQGSSDTVMLCAAIGGSSASQKNTFIGPYMNSDVYTVASGAASGHAFILPGYSGSTAGAIQAYLGANNSISGGATYQPFPESPATVSAFIGNGTSCGTP